MFKNYLKIALRNLFKHKVYSFISIAGLSVGIACCLMILLYIQHELSFDRYHNNGDRIYRLVKGNNANTPELWAPALENEFPEIEYSVRFMQGFSNTLIISGENRFLEERGLYADASVFEVFSWPLLRGNPKTVLQEPFTIVLSEKLARKYFSNSDPIGRVLTIGGISNDNDWHDYKVTGIVQNVPHYSHIQFDYLISFKTVIALNDIGEWGTPLGWTNRMAKTYLLLLPKVDARELEAKIPTFLQKHIHDEKYNYSDAKLQRLSSIYLHSNLRSEFKTSGTITYVYLFAVLAGFLILIACINFMNLATARYLQRAREIGVRKVMGAHRAHLIKQFLGESIMISLVALALAILLLEILQPVFHHLFGQELDMVSVATWPVMLGFIGLALIVGLLAGSYPAFFLSALRPVGVLQSETAGMRGAFLRKGLVVFQFVISVILLVSTMVVFEQLDYLQNKDLGFQKEQIVVMPIGHSKAIRSKSNTFKNELQQHPGILRVAGSHSLPGRFLNGFYYLREGAAQDDRVGLKDISVDHDFVEMFGLHIIAGRSFSADLASDSTAFVLNESAVKELGFENPEVAIHKQIEWLFPGLGFRGPVIGVVKDFHYESLHSAIPPIAMHITYFGVNFISARIQPTAVGATLDFLEQTWRRYEQDYPFEYYFFDENFARQYKAERRLGQTFGYFSALAIFITCLGLFGLATYSAERRTKEIGIRKVLGATVMNVTALLSKDFIKLVLLANLIAWPMAWFAMNKWLQNFAFRVDIGWWVFALAGGLTLLIALITVSMQTIRAALTNPVEALRNE